VPLSLIHQIVAVFAFRQGYPSPLDSSCSLPAVPWPSVIAFATSSVEATQALLQLFASTVQLAYLLTHPYSGRALGITVSKLRSLLCDCHASLLSPPLPSPRHRCRLAPSFSRFSARDVSTRC
jgi:hypothetical protein